MASAERPLELEVDACVVGSGAGGAACACELAEGGLRVALVEEGHHYQTADFTSDPITVIQRLYRHAGAALIHGRPPILFSEGRCVGGSTVINGGICWRTPEKVVKRWQCELGLADLDYARLEPLFQRVERALHVAEQDPGSVGRDAELLKLGADRLGYRTAPVRRNQRHCAGTNLCLLGCPTGAKQSTLVTYVPRALAAGATLLADCRVERVLVEGDRAAGVAGRFGPTADPTRAGRPVEVRARQVVLAGGALETPALLLKSRLCNSSGQVGRNFLCHPNAKAVGVFAEDVQGWKGTIQGWQVHEFLDEGLLITTSMVPPGLLALSLPWFGPASLEVMRDYNRMLVGGVLVEDLHAGRVGLDWFAEPRASYRLDARDAARLVRGVALTAEIYFAAGARRVLLPFAHLDAIDSPDDIGRLLAHPIPPSDIEVLTVHAMGTCRMGRDPRRSVVDSFGRTHDLANLWIADASVVPTPLGVNPMISIMTLAVRTAHRILDQEGG
jgi:choline dehydrogenase-like flavoprotein